MSDNFEKAAEDDAWLYRHRTNELDLKPTTTFVAGALWARAYLEKTTVPQEIVEGLVSVLERFANIKADDGDDFSGLHEDVILRVECTAGNLYEAREAIYKFNAFKNKRERDERSIR